MSDWVKAQEKNFASPEAMVDDEALANPIQRERIDRAVEFIGGPGLKVLDVGCSGGGISQLIHDKGNECWGMDLPGVLARVPEERKRWLKTFECDASKAPWTSGSLPEFPSDFFDVVWAGEIIEHMIDLEPFLSEAHRVIKPGGRIVLTTPNIVRELNRLQMILGSVHSWHEWEKIPHHVRYFTPDTLARALAQYGFKPTRFTSGKSQAEIGNSIEEQDWLSPEEKKVLRKLFDRNTPNPAWRQSFIIMEGKRLDR